MHYLKAMERLDRTHPTYKALQRKRNEQVTLSEKASQDSLLDHQTLKALDEAEH
jgi:hypothetical protein